MNKLVIIALGLVLAALFFSKPGDVSLPVVLLAVPGVLSVIMVIWGGRKADTRARTTLNRWLTENRYSLRGLERAHFRKGPFRWSSRGQVVFRIKILDQDNVPRTGWVRCGTRFKGAAFSDAIECILEPPQSKRE